MALPLKEIVNVQIGVSSGGPGIPTEIPVRGLTLNKYFWEMRVSDTDKLYPVFNPTNANDRKVFWSEDSNGGIVTVDDSGNVIGVAIGNATVTCITEDGAYRSTCLYNILRALIPISSITLDKYEATLEEGQSTKLTTTVLPDNADDKNINWRTSDHEVATVSEDGLVVAVKAGTANIYASAAVGDAESEPCVVTVKPPVVHVTDVRLDIDNIQLEVGKTQQLTETVLPTNATNKAVTWKTSSSSIATVSDTGLVTCVAAGNATITVETVDGGYSATCAVKVVEPVVKVTGVSIDNGDTAHLVVGKTIQLTATVEPANATNKAITWDTSDANILTVSATGLVTAVGVGEASITVTTHDGNFTDSIAVTTESNVSATPVITAQPASTTITVGQTFTMSVVATAPGVLTYQWYEKQPNNTWQVITHTEASWTSQPATTTAVRTFRCVVTNTESDKTPASVTSSEAVVTINAAGVPVTGVTIDEGDTGQVVKGSTAQLHATVMPTNASDKSVTWSTSDEAIATVSSAGLVTGVNFGSATITVKTVDGDFTDSIAMTVPSPGTLTTDTIPNVLVGNSVQLTYTTNPPNAPLTDITYTSSDEGIASVDDNGLITVHTAGTPSITMKARWYGVEVSDTSGLNNSFTLTVATASTNPIDKGTSATKVEATVEPAWAKDDPDYKIVYTTTDPAIATVDPVTGVITGVESGSCRVGATVTVRNATASDSSNQNVN